MLYNCSLFDICLLTLNSLDTECFIVFYQEYAVFGYLNILYCLSRLWPWTMKEHCLQVQRGSAKVKAS